MKRTPLCLFTLVLVIFLSLSAPRALGAPARAVVCGSALDRTELIDGTSFVPLRGFADALGLAVEWDDETSTARLSGYGINITVQKHSTYIAANDTYIYIPSGVLMSDGRMFVPSRALARAVSLDVEWDALARTVVFTGTPSAPAAPYSEDELFWLSRIINAESRGEPLEGKIAVGNVVLNRVASDEYPDTIYGVIFDDRYGVQFEPTLDRSIELEPTEESILAARLCLCGANVVRNSLYFLNPQKADDSWFRENLEYVATIGGHVFYA